MEEVLKHPGHANQKVHGHGSKGGGAGGLSPADDKKVNDLAIEMWNHRQTMPLSVKTGKNTPAADAYRTKFTRIIDTAAGILGKSPKDTYAELNRRMGVGS